MPRKSTQGQIFVCPKCNQPLTEIRYPSDSMLNRDQWESQLPGDLFCTCHNNHSGNKPYAYFWKSELVRESRVPVPEAPAVSEEELVIEIGRELYDRFVMGGWEPQEAYPQIREWLARARQGG